MWSDRINHLGNINHLATLPSPGRERVGAGQTDVPALVDLDDTVLVDVLPCVPTLLVVIEQTSTTHLGAVLDDGHPYLGVDELLVHAEGLRDDVVGRSVWEVLDEVERARVAHARKSLDCIVNPLPHHEGGGG